ncbi:hypothetical protein A9R05_09565 [Burkholderia sp. KK1]|nr:hypothetical protein A9R05_09565 [Burkholderia sp. KK1]
MKTLNNPEQRHDRMQGGPMLRVASYCEEPSFVRAIIYGSHRAGPVLSCLHDAIERGLPSHGVSLRRLAPTAHNQDIFL